MLTYILIAEDHPICAEAIKLAAQNHDSAIFVEMCDSLAEAEAMLHKRDYRLLVLDLGLKDSRGLINLTVIRKNFPKLPVLIISGQENPDIPVQARDLGAMGFLNKSASLDEIREAIAAVLKGMTHFDIRKEEHSSSPAVFSNLSKAQLRVMRELASGRSNKIIAYELGLSEPTVKSHLSAIYRALDVTNRSEAILKLQRLNAMAIH